MTVDSRLRVSAPQLVHARTSAACEAAVRAVLRSGRWVGGRSLSDAEVALAERVGRTHGVGVGSGTSALTLALQAAGVVPGDEVIVPAVSFVATATAVLRAGARPVVVDVTPGMPLIDPAQVRAACSPKVTAVVPVQLFGNVPRRLEGLSPDVLVIDDAAQAMGRDLPLGEGCATVLSFYPTKVLAAAGDAGLVATDDARLAAAVRALGSHGRCDGAHHRVQGSVAGNDRMDALQAAILVARLSDLDARITHRRALLKRYRERLPDLVLPHDPGSNVAVLAAVHPARDRIRASLAAEGIDTACYYPRVLSEEPVLADARIHGRLGVARRFCATCFALPCHIGLTLPDVDRVADAVLGAL